MKEFQYSLSNRGKRDRSENQQTFDRDEQVEIKGNKVKIVDFIQEEESNDIYYNLEKYGCLDRITVDKQKLYGDFEEYISLRDIQDKIVKADNMWSNLPLDIREKFHNNKMEFASQGYNWLKSEIEKEMKILYPKETKTEIKNEIKGDKNA